MSVGTCRGRLRLFQQSFSPDMSTDTPFAYTTREAARTLNTSVEAVRAQYQRTGAFRGIVPIKLPNFRLLWPRAEVLRVAGCPAAGPRTVIDLRATNPWLESNGLLPADPMAERIAIALNDPRDNADELAQCRLDEWCAMRDWINSMRRRLLDARARARLTPEQWTDAQRRMALAVANVVIELDPATLETAVNDVIGGKA